MPAVGDTSRCSRVAVANDRGAGAVREVGPEFDQVEASISWCYHHP